MTTDKENLSAVLAPADVLPAEGSRQDWAEALVSRARDEAVDLTGEDGLLTGLVRQVLLRPAWRSR